MTVRLTFVFLHEAIYCEGIRTIDLYNEFDIHKNENMRLIEHIMVIIIIGFFKAKCELPLLKRLLTQCFCKGK